MNTKHLYTSLDSGVTQGSVTDNTIIDISVIEIYFDNTDCYIDGTSQEGHTVYFTVGGNATGTNVCVVVNNLTDFVPYDDSALVSRVNTAEVNLGLLDAELDERVPDETILGGVLYHGTTGNTWKKLNANNLNYDDESTIYSAMGDIDSLETTSKNLVGAINEIRESGGESITDITNEFTFKTGISWDMSFSKIYKYGKLVKGILRFTTPSSGGDTNIITAPNNYKPLTTTVSQINRAWGGGNAGTMMYLDNGNIMLVSGDWTKNVNVYTTFEYILKE